MRRKLQVASVVVAILVISFVPLAAVAGDARNAVVGLTLATILVLMAILAERIDFPDDRI